MDHPRPSLRLPDAAAREILENSLAKREDKGQQKQSYWDHVTAVYEAWCSLKEVHAPLIARVAARYEITTERLLQSSLLCVALHDVGKLTRNFADMMRADDKDGAEYKAAVRRNYRHEVAPLWLITQAAQAMNKRQGRMARGIL